jgi:hypothetical protein
VIKTIHTCDHCGVELRGRMSMFEASFLGAAFDVPNIHACSREHLGYALASAFSLPPGMFENRVAQLETDLSALESALKTAEFERDAEKTRADGLSQAFRDERAANEAHGREMASQIAAGISEYQERIARLEAWKSAVEPIARRIARADAHGDANDIREITQDIVNAACALRHELTRLDNAETGAP